MLSSSSDHIIVRCGKLYIGMYFILELLFEIMIMCPFHPLYSLFDYWLRTIIKLARGDEDVMSQNVSLIDLYALPKFECCYHNCLMKVEKIAKPTLASHRCFLVNFEQVRVSCSHRMRGHSICYELNQL